jgi:hypothetical protein
MKNLFDEAAAESVKERIALLQPDSERLWGKMSPAQALAHCSVAMEVSLGDRLMRQIWFGKLVGKRAKASLLSGKPIRRNMPTDKAYVVTDERDLEVERHKLAVLIDRFQTGGPAGCTKGPHSFFGPLTPNEWAELNYLHLDHHLRQFGV